MPWKDGDLQKKASDFTSRRWISPSLQLWNFSAPRCPNGTPVILHFRLGFSMNIHPPFWETPSGWWLTFYPSAKWEFVNWDDEILNIWKNKSHVPVTTTQPFQEPPIHPSVRKIFTAPLVILWFAALVVSAPAEEFLVGRGLLVKGTRKVEVRVSS